MFTVTVETTFYACHQLTLPQGAKEPLHYHDWVVKVGVSAEKLDKMGLVIDFARLKKMIDEIISPFKNKQLETLEFFETINSSAENVAKYLFERMEKRLGASGKLEFVEVTEAAGCSAKYYKS